MLTLLATSPRVAPGVLTWRAWEALRSASLVLTGSADHPQLPYLRDAGVTVDVVEPVAATLVAAATEPVVWVAALDGDEELLRAIGAAVVGMDDPPAVELLHGAYDLPGARLLDLVTVMETLRRECPWDRKQTHESLVPYLLEESYEVLDAIETGDLAALREELGDVLMQVAFHAVVAAERTGETSFTIDDVAAGIVEKLVRRHPHVFGSVTVADADEVNENWEKIKKTERGEEASIFHGVPMGQPALALAAQLQRRADRADFPESLTGSLTEPPTDTTTPTSAPADAATPADTVTSGEIGAELFALVRRAREAGLDPEAELRAYSRLFRNRVQEWEQS
jgi:XTP/dITP diphosphohydrolase